MTLLVTGGTGFVMSVVVRQWLDADRAARVVILDSAPPDAAAQRYFAPVMDRLTMVVADVARGESWHEAVRPHAITHVVHGATVTPISRGTVPKPHASPKPPNPAASST